MVECVTKTQILSQGTFSFPYLRVKLLSRDISRGLKGLHVASRWKGRPLVSL